MTEGTVNSRIQWGLDGVQMYSTSTPSFCNLGTKRLPHSPQGHISQTLRHLPFAGTLIPKKDALSQGAGSLISHSACTHTQEKKLGFKVHPSAGLHFDAWDKELLGDPDREFILHGIKNGFDITDNNIDIQPVKCRNHPSARSGNALYAKATAQIQTEIEADNNIICEKPPSIISPIAVIPKSDDNVRLIHDCSRPNGQAVNDYCSSEWKQKFFQG